LKNILYFVRRHFHFLLFIFLQVFCIYQIVHYSAYHKAVFDEFSLSITGQINSRYHNALEYIRLKKINDSLQKANADLYNQLRQNYDFPDTVDVQSMPSATQDSLQAFKKIVYHPAKVVSNSVSLNNNYLVLNKGTADGIQTGMGVITHQNAVVGVVTEVGLHYAVVMSLLHKDSHLSGKLLRTGETGTFSWDGKMPNQITLNNIPKSVKVYKKDTVISSGFSTVLPKGKLIGFVEGIQKDSERNTFKIICRSAADFHSLDYVLVIENKDTPGIIEALEKVKKQN
jgi:rod shape-determining protein MreC